MNSDLTITPTKASSWQPLSGVTVGKDILELLSSSMYVDPMTIYREYIQNAADAIDEAVDQGVLTPPGRVDISVDVAVRSVRIRDNGIGVRKENFVSQLGTFGGSLKRRTAGRGFRGVGRLSGLGYCQKLTFRARATGDKDVSEMVWDCRKIKALLHSTDERWTLEDLLKQVVSVRRIPADTDQKSFFEVEMSGVIRHKNDVLLNKDIIYDYLSEVAPVPFHPAFSFGQQIVELLADKVALGKLDIYVEGKGDPVYRPHRDSIEINGELYDQFTDFEIFRLPSNNDGDAAIGWFLHHGYKGAIPDKRVGGLRARCGNIQIGSRDLFADVYKETRFNAWTVGEIHIFDTRITPNGRRDYFEQGVHLDNLLNHIAPRTRKITALCRESSRDRNRLQEFSRFETGGLEKLLILQNSPIDRTTRRKFLEHAKSSLDSMVQCVVTTPFKEEITDSLHKRIARFELELNRVRQIPSAANTLDQFSKSKREAYEQIIGLIFEFSDNKEAAQKLVNKIIDRLSS